MKKNFSVFSLMARFALWPTAIVTLLGAGATYIFLRIRFEDVDLAQRADYLSTAAAPLCVGFALLFVLLARPMRERGGVQPGYTLRRLGVSELAAYLWQAAANAMGFFIFLAGQAAACFAFALWAQETDGSLAGNMTALIMLYVSRTAHAIIPLSDWPVYIRMFAVLCALGCAAAYFPFMNRRGKTALSPFFALAAALLFAFGADVGEYVAEAVTGGAALITGALFVYAAGYRCGLADVDGAAGGPDGEADGQGS